MPIGLQEMHPATVHYPIALLPLSLGADALGRLTGDRTLMEMGRRTMPLAAVGAATAAVFGLIAQQAVRADGQAHDMLVTHRTLNAAVLGVTAAMASRRMRSSRPTVGYLAVGFAALGVMAYSAYLGGRMTYALGVGVDPAGGVDEARAPEIDLDNLGESARIAAGNLAQGIRTLAREAVAGDLVHLRASADRPSEETARGGTMPRW